MEQMLPVEKGAEAFLELLNANGVDYIFLNPGTDTFPIQEAICKFKALNKKTPEFILCLHESVAMAAAHGYFMVSGKPQIVLVHADLGPQQVGGALHNAQRGRIGVVLCSGRVPANIEEDRTNIVHWQQEQFDQAGVVRGYVKWDYELRSTENIHHVVQRAIQVTSSEPCGPVYLCLPQDVLVAKMNNVSIPDINRFAAPAAPQVDPTLLDEIAAMLISAENPLLITGYSGRHPQSVGPLVELAEAIGARVIESPSRMNFPTTHPLYQGFDPNPFLEKADVIMVIDNDVPYIPHQARPKHGTKIIHIDIDPLKRNIPLWGFPVDILVQGDSSRILPALSRVVQQKTTTEKRSRLQTRFQQLQSDHQQMKEKWRSLAEKGASQKPISPEWLCHCIDQVIDEETIVVSEAVTNRASVLRQIHRTQPGTYYQSGGSNLGWGLGAALGTKLAKPEKTVISLVGDGSFVFGCPTAALWGANVNQAPFLCVIFNNMRYNAPSLFLRRTFAKTTLPEQIGKWAGIDIKPSPEYIGVARACDAYAQKVEDPAELIPALKTALEEVRKGKPAVLDVRIGVL